MLKTVTFEDGRELTLSNATEWIFIYNDQFGHDIVETLTPLISTGVQIIGGVLEQIGPEAELDAETVAKLYDSEAVDRALLYFSTLRMTDMVNITWAMAKAADESIPEPRKWVKGLDVFPIDLLTPVVLELVISGFTTSKNWERLRDTFKVKQPQNKKTTQTKK